MVICEWHVYPRFEERTGCSLFVGHATGSEIGLMRCGGFGANGAKIEWPALAESCFFVEEHGVCCSSTTIEKQYTVVGYDSGHSTVTGNQSKQTIALIA